MAESCASDTVFSMKKVALVLIGCMLVSSVLTASYMWWSARPEPGRDARVEFDGVSYGLSSIKTPILDSLGAKCAPRPQKALGSNEEWPDAQVAPDPSYRDALPDELREVYDCILVCLPSESSQWQGMALSVARPCFEENVIDLSTKVGFVKTFTAMGALLKTYPKLTFFCHESGHKAGAAAFAAGVPLEEALPVVGDNCVHGAVHGLLDGFSLSSPSIEDFDKVADICQKLDGAAAGGCTDGMGHAAWDAFKDFKLTSEACRTIESLDLRYACDEGVLMRRYERIGSVKGNTTEDYKELTASLRKDCATWAEVAVSRADEPAGPASGCYAGVQYMLWEPIVVFTREYPEERWRGVPNMQELLDEVLYTCASFGKSGEDLCRARDGYHVATATNYKTEDFEQMCALLRTRVETCVELANKLTRENSAG